VPVCRRRDKRFVRQHLLLIGSQNSGEEFVAFNEEIGIFFQLEKLENKIFNFQFFEKF